MIHEKKIQNTCDREINEKKIYAYARLDLSNIFLY